MKSKIVLALTTLSLLALPFLGAACMETDADVASKNISKSAEQFELNRRIVFINGITDKYLLSIEGKCSVETADAKIAGTIEVLCKMPDGSFKRNNLGLSDNVTFMVEQLDGARVSTTHYRVIFKPETIVPDFDRP